MQIGDLKRRNIKGNKMNYSLKSVRPKIAQRALLLGLAAGVQVAYADDVSPNEYAKAIDQVNYQGASQETLARPSFNEALTPMANRFLGQTPSAAQIDELTAEMSAALRKTGLVVARVLVTDADKQAARETGVLRFTVFEGRVGKISVTNTSKVNTERLLKTLANAVCGDASEVDPKTGVCVGSPPLTDGRIERATLNASDIPGVRLKSIGLSGQDVGVGETQAVIVAEPRGDANQYSVGFDNYGANSLGRARIALSAQMANLFGEGDVTSARVQATAEKLYTGNLSYSMPLGYSGLRGNTGVSRTEYTVGGIDMTGVSNSAFVGVSYPVLRAFDYNVVAGLNYDYAKSKGKFKGKLLTSSDIGGARLSINVDDGDRRRDLGQSFTRFGLNYSVGDVKIKDAASLAADQEGPKTDGMYHKVDFNLFRKQNLNAARDPLYAILQLRGQFANKNLDGSLKMSSGGPSGIRAYPVEEPSGNSSAAISIDLRQPISIGSGMKLIPGVFVDVGRYAQNKGSYGELNKDNDRTLAAAGVSLEVQTKYNLTAGLMWAHRLGNEKSIASPDSKSRLWVTLGMSF
jgi:hemolysin activation/secretion protein